MAKRIIYDVKHGKHGGWYIFQRGEKIYKWYRDTKREAVKFITHVAHVQWKSKGVMSQVVIRLRNGRIQEERGYPDTTRRRKG